MMQQPQKRIHDARPCQLEAYHFSAAREATFLNMAMGAGKSKVAIDLVANQGNWANVLILCPKSVLGVWRREIERHFPAAAGTHSVCILEKGTSANKAEQFRDYFEYDEADFRFVIVNYETAWRPALHDLLLSHRWQWSILDESHRIKMPAGKAAWFAKAVGAKSDRKLCLTGTPMPHSPLDIYAQFRYLKPDVFGTNFARFRADYAVMNPVYKGKVDYFVNQDHLSELFHANAYTCTAEQALADLPAAVHQDVPFDLTPKSRNTYDELENLFYTEVDEGTVNAGNALVKLLRLQQVTSGFVTAEDDDGNKSISELGEEKADLLSDLLEDLAGERVVVFCRFQRDLDIVQAMAFKHKMQFGELSGRRRDAIDEHSCLAPGVEVAAVQLQSGGVGIDLTGASVGIYYSLNYSLGDFDQSQARLVRPGQSEHVRFFHLVGNKTIDQKVYRALKARRNVVDAVLIKGGD